MVASGVLLYQAFIDRADERIAYGTVVTGEVAGVGAGRGPESVTVNYAFEGKEYEATARSLFGRASYYREVDEIELYVESR